MRDIVLLLHNIRSIHNVGSILRTADGFGIARVIYSGYTPYPRIPGDTRLPHLIDSLTNRIHKTALGAEASVEGSHVEYPDIDTFKKAGFRIVGLEQSDRSVRLDTYVVPDKLLLVMGEEVDGIPKDILTLCEDVLEIPMRGTKESFNVSVASAIAMYELTLDR